MLKSLIGLLVVRATILGTATRLGAHRWKTETASLRERPQPGNWTRAGPFVRD
ncbi:MAG: hypothetical protein SGI84_14675 [Gemmatimonadota bacterium]|nr:hypothetical protein [Gemmatimonadota bacterium]